MSVLALILCVIFIVTVIITNSLFDNRLVRARDEAKLLAVQIISGGLTKSKIDILKNGKGKKDRKPSNNDQARSIASVVVTPSITPEGRIGLDPWGTPYFYKITVTDMGEAVVEVLSAGADKSLQSHLGTSESLGDDIVAIEKATF